MIVDFVIAKHAYEGNIEKYIANHSERMNIVFNYSPPPKENIYFFPLKIVLPIATIVDYSKRYVHLSVDAPDDFFDKDDLFQHVAKEIEHQGINIEFFNKHNSIFIADGYVSKECDIQIDYSDFI